MTSAHGTPCTECGKPFAEWRLFFGDAAWCGSWKLCDPCLPLVIRKERAGNDRLRINVSFLHPARTEPVAGQASGSARATDEKSEGRR